MAFAIVSDLSDPGTSNPFLAAAAGVALDGNPSVLPGLAISPWPTGASSIESADGEGRGLPLRSRDSLVRLQTDEIEQRHLHIFFGAIRTESWPILVLPSARDLL